MYTHLLCLFLGLSLPFLLPFIIRSLTGGTIYDNTLSDAIALNASVDSMWFNLGYWSTTKGGEGERSFPNACKALVELVCWKGGLKDGDRVVEVGCGNGDSAQLVCSKYKLESYLGITAVGSQTKIAEERSKQLRNKAVFRTGDAVEETRSLSERSVDFILAVDCVYHFNTRQTFLHHAHSALSPSGRLAMTDMLLPSHSLPLLDHILLRSLCFLADLPFTNLLTPPQYLLQLERSGWSNVELKDISEDVFPGFVEFVERRSKTVGSGFKAWGGLVGYAKVVRWYMNLSQPLRPRLRFYLITAEKSSDLVETL